MPMARLPGRGPQFSAPLHDARPSGFGNQHRFAPRIDMNPFKKLIAACWLCTHSMLALAAIDPELLKPLAGDDPDARIEAVGKIAALANDDAFKLLDALRNDALYAAPDGRVFIVEKDR